MYAEQIQPAIKKETLRVTCATSLGTLIMLLVFFFLHQRAASVVPFDSRVLLSSLLGTAAACLNFFFMGITVQKVTSAKTDEDAYKTMKISYRFRTAGQLFWIILAFVLPFLNGAAGILPLFLPGICIKAGSLLGILKNRASRNAPNHERR